MSRKRGESATGTSRLPWVRNPELDDWMRRQCEQDDRVRATAFAAKIDAEIAPLMPIITTIDSRRNRGYSSENIKKYNALLTKRRDHLSAPLDITPERRECSVCKRFHVKL